MPFSVKSRSLANTENDVRSKNIIFLHSLNTLQSPVRIQQ